MARKSVKSTEAPQFDYKAFLTETMDSVTTRLNFDSDPIESATPMSTGMLVLDLLYGGGIRAGWYTNFGKEQSSKTTGALVIAANAVKAGVPIISFFDYEASSVASMPYIRSILKTCGIDKTLGEVFGQKDQETGKWITAPIIRFSAEALGERFFDLLSATLRSLPDKKSVGGKWWLVYEDNKVNKAKLGEFSDPSMAKRYGSGIWIPAPNAELQAIFIVDSYPAMNPSANDEDETNNSIALQARMFSKQLPRVKGYLAKKMVAVIGTNQLRANPLDRYHPEVEPCGESLKYNCFGEDTLLHTKYGMLSAREFAAVQKHTHLQSIVGMEKTLGYKCVGFSDTIDIESDFGYHVTGKPGHKVLVARCGEQQYPTLSWTTLEEFSSINLGGFGCYMAISCNEVEKPTEYQQIHFKAVGSVNRQSQLKNDTLDLICDENLAELLGWIVSEGFVSKQHFVTTIANKNPQYLSRIETLCDRLGFKSKRHDTCITVNGVLFAQWLASIGLCTLAKHKEIPLIIRMSPADVQLAFLRGLFAGDAYGVAKETNYYSISNTLLDQLQVMLLSFGIISRKKKYTSNRQEHRFELTSEETHKTIRELLDVQNECLLQQRFTAGVLAITGSNNTKLRKLIKWRVSSLAKNSNNTVSDVLPELFSNYKRTRKPKVYGWFRRNIMRRNDAKYWRVSKFYDGWFDDYLAAGESLRTSQERESWANEGMQIKRFVDFTRKHNIIWRRITQVNVARQQVCYDACMPKSHTIITNGIVSHNSDVRCKFTPRASGQPLWPKNFDKDTGWEIEKSVETENGRDSYRYIHVKTVKNKLSTPNRIGWLRIWASDASGEGRGYDPVFDTAYYLYLTGQLVGRGRRSMKLLLNKAAVQPSITWEQIKLWVLGTTAQKKEICKALGFTKSFDLRKLCFHQLRTGVGEKLYVEHSQTAVEETED